MVRLLSASEVRQILFEVVAEIARDAPAASIHVIGGAAMSFHNPERTATTDVDGYIRPVEAGQVLSVIQARWGLDGEWFNDKALGLRPPVAGPEMWWEVHRQGDVVLYAANLESLLAMKLNAGRSKDMDDIRFLLNALGIEAVTDAEVLFEAYYPGDVLPDRSAMRLRHILGSG